jgi:tetratricopeptide (TPR) repeat protein
MVKSCPICGATPMPGARFCRACGSPLKAASASDGSSEVVSPLAQTIPLAGEGRPTDGIAPGDASYAKPDTARVRHEEMERLLSQNPEHDNGKPDVVSQDLSKLPVSEKLSETEPGAEQSAATASSSSTEKKNVVTPSRRKWQLAAALLLFIALTAGVLAIYYSRRPASIDAGGTSPIAISDQKKLVDEQFKEAENLLAAGDTDGAIAKLRYAVKLDPSNAEAHFRLGRALEKKGERREAITEYRAATESDPSNTIAWRALASAQFSEKLYQDAAESYARIISQMDDAEIDDNLRLDYADALRLAGRTEEARTLYQKVSASESRDLAERANGQLAQLPQPQTVGGGDNETEPREQRPSVNHSRPSEEGGANNTLAVNSQQSAPVVPAPQPANNRPAEKSSDNYYREALNIVQGRDVKSLQRAELLRALQLFQNVRDGAHSSDAKRYVERLGKEYDRRRKND